MSQLTTATPFAWPAACYILVGVGFALMVPAGSSAAMAEVSPGLARRYNSARGKGGFVRASWDEAVELAAAAHVRTIRTWGPDRIAGFSPIPATSMVSHTAGVRFHALIGAPMLSFYDWYADLPVASPQVFGDQTDVPEAGDWWDASYLVLGAPTRQDAAGG